MSLCDFLICGALEELTYLLIVCHDREPCKAAEPIDITVWVVGSGWPKEPCVRWGPDPPCEGAIVRGKGAAHRDSAVSCAKSAEPFEIQFMMWTPVGQRKRALNGGARCRYLTNITEPSTYGYGGDAAFSSNYFDHLFSFGVKFVVSNK